MPRQGFRYFIPIGICLIVGLVAWDHVREKQVRSLTSQDGRFTATVTARRMTALMEDIDVFVTVRSKDGGFLSRQTIAEHLDLFYDAEQLANKVEWMDSDLTIKETHYKPDGVDEQTIVIWNADERRELQ